MKNVYCLTGLHSGVFQGLDKEWCKHTFWVAKWDDGDKPRPNNVEIMTPQMINDPDENFFDCILIFPEHYDKVKNINKTILVYFVMNGREGDLNNYTKYIISNPRVIPIFVSSGCKLSHGIFDVYSKTIYPGIDEQYWNGWIGNEKKIIHVRNSFKNRDQHRYNQFVEICGNNPYTLIGYDGSKLCKYPELREEFRNHRVFVNVEIFTSTFSISSMEAMMTGMPIICNDIECTGEAIRNGVEGFISNNITYLKNKTNDLLNDYEMAKEMGKNARNMAELKFGKKQFNLQWDDFLDNIDLYKRN